MNVLKENTFWKVGAISLVTAYIFSLTSEKIRREGALNEPKMYLLGFGSETDTVIAQRNPASELTTAYINRHGTSRLVDEILVSESPDFHSTLNQEPIMHVQKHMYDSTSQTSRYIFDEGDVAYIQGFAFIKAKQNNYIAKHDKKGLK